MLANEEDQQRARGPLVEGTTRCSRVLRQEVGACGGMVATVEIVDVGEDYRFTGNVGKLEMDVLVVTSLMRHSSGGDVERLRRRAKASRKGDCRRRWWFARGDVIRTVAEVHARRLHGYGWRVGSSWSLVRGVCVVELGRGGSAYRVHVETL